MKTQENYSWLKKINKAILKLDDIPLFKLQAPFNFEELASLLANKFQLEHVSLKASKLNWKTGAEIQENMGDDIEYLAATLSPLDGAIYFLMNKEDISKLTKQCLTKEHEHGFSNSILAEGFYRFLAMQTIDYLTQMNLFQDLSVKLTENVKPITEASLCLDITIKINNTNLTGRIAITPELRTSWEKTFLHNPPLYAKEIASSLNLPIRAEIGNVQLNLEEFKKVKCGDFIILDKVTYDPNHHKGKTLLYLKESPLLYGKIKQNKIKILDYADYFEENKIMQEEKSEENVNLSPEEIKVTQSQENLASMQEMPVTITVEAARFKITLDKLMNLQPGNVLDLEINPQQGVDLSVNGQKIGKAELINLGETLGIRITEMG